MTNQITTKLDLDSSGFVSQLKKVKTDILAAEGAAGKMKAGVSGMSDVLKQNAVAAASAAGVALVSFGVKAASAFQDTALAAGKFADATGLAVEDASRWIEVAGDIGIEAGTIEGSFTKLNKAIADGKPALEQYGVEVVKTADGVTDANATFLNARDAIAAIEDPTARAKAAQELFGRSYTEVAELLEMSAGDVRSALGNVSDAKVIDEEELAKARDMRARLDDLKDTFEDVTLGVGEFVVSMGPAITKITQITKGILGVTTAVADFLFASKASSKAADDWWKAVGGPQAMSRGEVVNGFLERFNENLNNNSMFENAAEGAKVFFGELALQGTKADVAFESFKATFDELASKSPETAEQLLADMGKLRAGTDETSVKFQEWAEFAGLTDERMLELANSIPATSDAAKELADNFTTVDRSARDFTDEVNRAERATRDLENAYKSLTDELSDEESWIGVENAIDDYKAKINEAGASNRDKRLALVQLKQELIGYLSELEGVPAERQTEILALIDQGAFDEAEKALGYLSRQRSVAISPTTGGQLPNVSSGINGRRAAGGPVAAGGAYLVGENGPEILQMGGTGGNVVPNHKLGGGATYNITTAADPNAVVAAIKQYERLNGKGWRS